MRPSIGLVFTVYGNPRRLSTILRAFDEVDSWGEALCDELLIVEDPSTNLAHEGFARLAEKYEIQHYLMPEWGCMQGSGQAMMEQTESDWIIYFPDDLLPTHGSIANMMRWIRFAEHEPHRDYRIGGIQMPYWNFEELFPDRVREECFGNPDLSWLRSVPWNHHWWGPAYYVNINGAGFAVKRQGWQEAGGFPKKTWCLDEHLSCKYWLECGWATISVPGPPFVHAGGLSTVDQHANNRAHMRHSTLDGWYDEWGPPPEGTKDALHERCREVMARESARTGIPDRKKGQ